MFYEKEEYEMITRSLNILNEILGDQQDEFRY